MKILIVDDDTDTAQYLQSLVKQKHFVSELVHNGYDALHSIRSIKYDLILLDIDLPYINGRDILQKIRKLNIDTPLIIISALASVQEKVNVLSYGADDYITKPFDGTEFIARVEAVNRRYLGMSSPKVSCGNVSLNTADQIAYVDDKALALTKKEYIILQLLITRKNCVICKELFLDHLYNNAFDEPNMKIIDVFICKLRRKIISLATNKDDLPSIKTVWGRGYVMTHEKKISDVADIADASEIADMELTTN